MRAERKAFSKSPVSERAFGGGGLAWKQRHTSGGWPHSLKATCINTECFSNDFKAKSKMVEGAFILECVGKKKTTVKWRSQTQSLTWMRGHLQLGAVKFRPWCNREEQPSEPLVTRGSFQDYAPNVLLSPKAGPQYVEASALSNLGAHLQCTPRNICEWLLLFHAFLSFNRLYNRSPVCLALSLGMKNTWIRQCPS